MPVDELVDEIEMTFEERCEEEDWRGWFFERSGFHECQAPRSDREW
jgi:hypothetical protein